MELIGCPGTTVHVGIAVAFGVRRELVRSGGWVGVDDVPGHGVY